MTLDRVIEQAERIKNTIVFEPKTLKKEKPKKRKEQNDDVEKNSDKQKSRFKKYCYNKQSNQENDCPTYKKWEKKEKKELFVVMDMYFAKKAKKEQEKATKEFTVLSITPSSDSSSSSSDSEWEPEPLELNLINLNKSFNESLVSTRSLLWGEKTKKPKICD